MASPGPGTNPSRLPVSKLQAAAQQRRYQKEPGVVAVSSVPTQPDSEKQPAPVAAQTQRPDIKQASQRGQSPSQPTSTGRPRRFSAPSAMSLPFARPSLPLIPDHSCSDERPQTPEDPSEAPPTPELSSQPISPSRNIGSPDSAAAHTAVTRGRVSSVDRILAELNYPRTVAKVVAEYNPTTREQLLCELRKEEVRTKWGLTPMAKRRPVEVLKQQLIRIDREYGRGYADEGMQEVEDVDQLAKRRRMRKRIDDANEKWVREDEKGRRGRAATEEKRGRAKA